MDKTSPKECPRADFLFVQFLTWWFKVRQVSYVKFPIEAEKASHNFLTFIFLTTRCLYFLKVTVTVVSTINKSTVQAVVCSAEALGNLPHATWSVIITYVLMDLVVDDDADCTAFVMVLQLQNQAKLGTQRISLEHLLLLLLLLYSSH